MNDSLDPSKECLGLSKPPLCFFALLRFGKLISMFFHSQTAMQEWGHRGAQAPWSQLRESQ
jgi:hypothetical protein